jgi:hypothetical protein
MGVEAELGLTYVWASHGVNLFEYNKPSRTSLKRGSRFVSNSKSVSKSVRVRFQRPIHLTLNSLDVRAACVKYGPTVVLTVCIFVYVL